MTAVQGKGIFTATTSTYNVVLSFTDCRDNTDTVMKGHFNEM